MTTITDVQMAEWLQILESDPWEDELSGLARKAIPILCAEVERLRATAGERDALREALQLGVNNLREWVDRGVYIVSSREQEWLEQAERALAVVPEPQADDRLVLAKAVARKMQIEAMAALYDAGSDLHVIVRALDHVEITRCAVEEQEKP